MATPEVVLGASLLTIFVQGFYRLGLHLGFWTIVFSHTMFCLSFVVVTVRARLQPPRPPAGGGCRRPLRRAAGHLLASDAAVDPPRCRGRGAAQLRAQLRRRDHHHLRLRRGQHLPDLVYTAYLRGIPAEANVIGSAMLLAAIACVAAGMLLGRHRVR